MRHTALSLRKRLRFSWLRRLTRLKLFGWFSPWMRVLVVVVGVLWVWWVLKPRVWSEQRRVTVVMATPSLLALSYDPTLESLVVWQFPDDLEIEVVGGYGAYPARSISGLDDLEKQQGKLVMGSVIEILGVGVDGYMRSLSGAEEGKTITRAGVERRLRASLGKKALGGQNSSLSLGDMWRLYRAVTAVRLDKVDIVNLGDVGVLNREMLPDGVVVYKTDVQRVDALVQRYMTDEQLVNEGAKVLIFNATGGLGLGTAFSRMLTNVGIQVVGIEDDQRQRNNSVVEVRSAELQRTGTLQYIEKQLGVVAEVEAFGEMRGDVIIRLGKDYQERIRGK